MSNEFGIDDWGDMSFDFEGDNTQKNSIPTEEDLEKQKQSSLNVARQAQNGQRPMNGNAPQNGVRPNNPRPMQNGTTQGGVRPSGQRPVQQQSGAQRPGVQRPMQGGQNIQGQSQQIVQQRPRPQTQRPGTEEQIKQKLSRASEVVNNVSDKATEFTKDYSEKLKQEYNADMSEDMKEKGKFGWSLYLYAVLAFGFFMFESSIALLLLAGWVILTERNKTVNKMIISTIVLYVMIKLGWSVFTSTYSLVYGIIPGKLFMLELYGIKDAISSIKKVINNLYDFVFILVGIRGLLLAKKGEYIKLKFVENLF